MDDINSIVTKHIRSARAKRYGIFKPSTSSGVVQQHHQQQQIASSVKTGQQISPPPPLQNMGHVLQQFSCEDIDGMTFANL